MGRIMVHKAFSDTCHNKRLVYFVAIFAQIHPKSGKSHEIETTSACMVCYMSLETLLLGLSQGITQRPFGGH